MLQQKFLVNLINSTLLIVLAISPAFAKSSSMAVVDISRIYKEYTFIQVAAEKIKQSEESLKRVIATAKKEVKGLQGKEDEKSKKRLEEIQATVDEEAITAQQLKKDYNYQVNRNIQNTLNELAKKGKYDAVFDKSYVAFSATDITDELLKALAKIKS